MTIATVRSGLQTRLATISGLRVSAVWPNQINPPAALVKPIRIDSFTSLSGRASIFCEILVLVQITDMERGQNLLDPYLDASGDSSIVAAIYADQTLGGAAEGLLIGDWTDYGVIIVNETEWVGARLEVEVWVTY